MSTISASDPPFAPGTTQVAFAWPVAFVIATLLGGVVGALLRADARKRLAASIGIGVLAAIVVGVAHVIGISHDAWTTPAGATGEGLFFVVGAVAGFMGREAMTALAGH